NADVLETKITAAGEIVSRKRGTLPQKLPDDLMTAVNGNEGFTPESISWAGHDGQLIAIVKGKAPGGMELQVAINRVGERFNLDSKGKVAGPQEDWRLQLVVSMDGKGEVSAGRSLDIALFTCGPLIWIAMILGGWLVAHKAMAPVREMAGAAKRIELTNLGE